MTFFKKFDLLVVLLFVTRHFFPASEMGLPFVLFVFLFILFCFFVVFFSEKNQRKKKTKSKKWTERSLLSVVHREKFFVKGGKLQMRRRPFEFR